MSYLDQEINALLSAEEADADPDVRTAMAGITRGIGRRKRRRAVTAGAAAATVAAVAAIAPMMNRHGLAPHTAAHRPTVRSTPTLSRASTLAPTWIPAGLTETGRSLFLIGTANPTWGVTRTWSKSPNTIPAVAVTDQPTKEPIPPKAGDPIPVTVAGRSGQAWVDHSLGRNAYVIIVHWSAGHWLSVDVSDMPDMPATALRVANSVVGTVATVSSPVSCSVCNAMTVDVSGTRSDWSGGGMADDGIEFLFDRIPVQTNMVTVPLGGGMFAHLQATDAAQKSRLTTVAKTVRWTNPDYSWMGTRP